MSLGRSRSIARAAWAQQQREKAVVEIKKDLVDAVQFDAGDPALPAAIERLDGKGRVLGLDYALRELPSRQCILMLPVGHRNFDKLNHP